MSAYPKYYGKRSLQALLLIDSLTICSPTLIGAFPLFRPDFVNLCIRDGFLCCECVSCWTLGNDRCQLAYLIKHNPIKNHHNLTSLPPWWCSKSFTKEMRLILPIIEDPMKRSESIVWECNLEFGWDTPF